MTLDGKLYRDSISIAEQNLAFFKKSAEQCNIPVMLDNSTLFLEAIKHSDNLYFGLVPKIKESEKNANRKSRALLEQYFNIKSRIRYLCKCKGDKRII